MCRAYWKRRIFLKEMRRFFWFVILKMVWGSGVSLRLSVFPLFVLKDAAFLFTGFNGLHGFGKWWDFKVPCLSSICFICVLACYSISSPDCVIRIMGKTSCSSSTEGWMSSSMRCLVTKKKGSRN